MTISEAVSSIIPKTDDGHVSVGQSTWSLLKIAFAVTIGWLLWNGNATLTQIDANQREHDKRLDSLEGDRQWVKQAQGQAAIDHERRITNLENDLLEDVMSAYANLSKRFDTLIDKVQGIERKVDVLEVRTKP